MAALEDQVFFVDVTSFNSITSVTNFETPF